MAATKMQQIPKLVLLIQKAKIPQTVVVQGISWSCWADLNRRPHPYQGCALPTELQQRIWRPGTGSNRRPLA